MKKMYPLMAGHFHGKTAIVLGVCLVLGAGLISVAAAETPAPAPASAIREVDAPAAAAIPVITEPKANALNRPQMAPSRASLRSPVLITPYGIEKKPRRIYAAVGVEKG